MVKKGTDFYFFGWIGKNFLPGVADQKAASFKTIRPLGLQLVLCWQRVWQGRIPQWRHKQ